MLKEQQAAYKVRDKLIEVLKEQLEVLSSSMPPASGKVKKPARKGKPGKE
jgi:hypothetical protein